MPFKIITPFTKQCFVVLGTTINTSQLGLVSGLASNIIYELKESKSPMIANDESASWIASIQSLSMILGNITVTPLMAKLGRKRSTIISVVIIFIGWICILVAKSLQLLLIGRFFQGLSCGMSLCSCSVIIGEYTSPKNRGAFSTVTSILLVCGTLTVHALGSFLSWKKTASVCAFITTVSFIMVLFSPESPSWLAERGRYDECRKAFRWLRGDKEEEELSKLIEVCKQKAKLDLETQHYSVTRSIKSTLSNFKDQQFYKPIIIMLHLYVIAVWAGSNILAPYIIDMINITAGEGFNISVVIIITDVIRTLSTACCLIVIKKIKRRLMLFITVSLNVAVFLISAGYIYCTQHEILAVNSSVGITLIQILSFSVGIGSLPIPLVIAGEIFPLRYRSLSSGFSSVFSSTNTFVCVKSFHYLLNNIGLAGAYCVYSGLMTYCLVVVAFMLPETKDRTLQDIEDDFKLNVSDNDLKLNVPLKNGEEQDD